MKIIIRLIIVLLIFTAGCSNGGSIGVEPGLGVPVTPFNITDSSQLIGGSLAQGRIGDQLLSNDKIRVVIQQPSKFAQVCPFGGTIIDADIVRSEGTGQDNFGKMCPLVNVEWTVNYYAFEAISEGKDGSAKILRATGTIDVLDYLDLDFIAPVAKALTGQSLYFSPRYDDANNPFRTYKDLAGLDITVTTDYILEPGANYVKMETKFKNNGDTDAAMPIGQFVNGSGQIQLLIPGQGFSPSPTAQITGDTPAIVYVPFRGVDVSYGYFYDLRQFSGLDSSAVNAQSTLVSGSVANETSRLKSTSLSYSGVTGVLLGEDFLKAMPLGGPSELKVNFKVPAKGERVVTEYFIVGDSNVSTVFNTAMKLLDIPTKRISGKVVDKNGSAVADADVVVQNETNMTIITGRTKADGLFSFDMSTGTDSFAKAFGTGKYKIFVDKPGYHYIGTNVAGKCSVANPDVRTIDQNGIVCTLGESASVEIAGGVKDKDSGKNIPARLTIVGFDPSPDNHAGATYATTHGAGAFEDTWIFERPWGIVDVKYVNIKGGFGLDNEKSFALEPGHYAFVFSRGTEYSMEVREMDITTDSKVTLDNIYLKRVVKTPGWISTDFHLHNINSPDSAIPVERRVLASTGEGMDVLQSSDHDWLTDYGPYVEELTSDGLIDNGCLATIVGQELSPNHYGHIHAFPLEFDSSKIDGGALDWTYSPFDTADPSADYVMSPRDIVDYYKSGGGGSGEKVLQVNHVADQATSLLIVSSWVSTTAYSKNGGVAPLSSYVEPSAQRIKPANPTVAIPTPYGSNELVIADFTTLELTIGPELYTDLLKTTGLPQWFNLLNLGLLVTGSADSDSHRETVDQLGMPRNYIASSVDPKDGKGDFSSFSNDDYANAINRHKLVATTGPFVKVTAKNENGNVVGIGDLISGKTIQFHIEVEAPSWAWFDTIEIYANTDPLPADEDGVSVFSGTASDPKTFFAPYHIPKFYYEPQKIYTKSDGTLKDWKEEDGLIKATLDMTMNVDEDTWVVVYVYGDPASNDWRSVFPMVSKSVASPDKAPKIEDGWKYDKIIRDPAMKASAWAFANPIFIDVDGDANGDGNPFEAKYIRDGSSPLAN